MCVCEYVYMYVFTIVFVCVLCCVCVLCVPVLQLVQVRWGENGERHEYVRAASQFCKKRASAR